MDKHQVNQYSPLTLAFLGDAVYEQLVRKKIVSEANMPVGKLHDEAVKHVKAAFQSRAVDVILPMLNEDEAAAYRRGKNSSPSTVPKSSNPLEYGRATGFEALFGYLSLLDEDERIEEIFNAVWERTELL